MTGRKAERKRNDDVRGWSFPSALVLGPALGGFLLFGSLLPSPVSQVIGGLLGAALGASAGLVRIRRWRNLHRA